MYKCYTSLDANDQSTNQVIFPIFVKLYGEK